MIKQLMWLSTVLLVTQTAFGLTTLEKHQRYMKAVQKRKKESVSTTLQSSFNAFDKKDEENSEQQVNFPANNSSNSQRNSDWQNNQRQTNNQPQQDPAASRSWLGNTYIEPPSQSFDEESNDQKQQDEFNGIFGGATKKKDDRTSRSGISY